jgi:hypothetical protein
MGQAIWPYSKMLDWRRRGWTIKNALAYYNAVLKTVKGPERAFPLFQQLF